MTTSPRPRLNVFTQKRQMISKIKTIYLAKPLEDVTAATFATAMDLARRTPALKVANLPVSGKADHIVLFTGPKPSNSEVRKMLVLSPSIS